MSLPSMHIAVGMSFPFLAGVLAYVKKGFQLTSRLLFWVSCAMFFCGMWAMGPDFMRFAPEQGIKHYYAVTHEQPPVYFNIFFFHGLLDKYQSEERGLYLGTVMFLAMFFSIFFACARQLIIYKRKLKGYLKQKESS